MRKAWELAKNCDRFDFYIWLNDDTTLFPNAILGLFNDYSKVAPNSLIVGACTIPGTNKFSYGGHGQPNPIRPSGTVQAVTYFNGNFVLIPSEVERTIGPISPAYTHYLGDYDYALRSKKAGFTAYTSSRYLAECLPYDLPKWENPSVPFSLRWRLLRDIKGLALKEYIFFKSYHFGKWIRLKSYLDVHFKALNPKVYVMLRNFIFKGG